MLAYCARVRFKLGARVRLISDDPKQVIVDSHKEQVTLEASPPGPMKDAEHVALFAGPYETEPDAIEGGQRWRRILEKALARANVGAEFGDRAPSGAATEHYLALLSAEYGVPVLNDIHGVMAFGCEPRPRFIRSEVRGVVGKDLAGVLEIVRTAAARNLQMSPVEQLAYEIYSASFSTDVADARFMLLMMAVETLIEPVSRSSEVIGHVDALIVSTKASELSRDEVSSITGSLSYLKTESIGQAGRRLASSLGPRRYVDLAPPKFFTRCYELRSRLAHGAFPRPPWAEVNIMVAPLELFVRDLLSVELLADYPDA
jgi:hypothetical protein